MTMIRLLTRLFLVSLFMAFGTVAALAAPADWIRVSYPVEAYGLTAQSDNLTNTARAPPTASENVLATGTAFAQTGDSRTLDDMKTSVAAYTFLRSSLAPNRAVTRVGDGPLPTGQQTLDPTEISFSQATVSGRTSDGLTHDE